MKERLYLMVFNEDWADEHDVPAIAVKTYSELESWKKKKIEIYAQLGNSGDCFDEQFEECETGEDYLVNGYVELFEVDESFKKIFDNAKLNYLSLCNIFD